MTQKTIPGLVAMDEQSHLLKDFQRRFMNSYDFC